jgi:hypothetical protein
MWAVGVAIALTIGPAGPAGAASPPDTVHLEITSWAIKPSITVTQDLARMAATVGISTSSAKDKTHTERWGSYYSRQVLVNQGRSAPLDAKIGTARLASPAPANIAVEFTEWYTGLSSPLDTHPSNGSLASEDTEGITLFFFKGSDKADVYGTYRVTALKPGKTVQGEGGDITLGVPRKFVRNKTYRASVNPVLSVSGIAPGEGLAKLNSSGEPAASTIYYKDGRYAVKLDLSFPAVHQEVAVRVKNVGQNLNTKRDAKNPIYRAAAKLVGKYSESCGYTQIAALNGSKVNQNGAMFLNVSLDEARTGDMVMEPGHVSIFTGPGATAIQGDVFSHKTFRQDVPLRNGYYAERPYSNVFRYHTK